MSMSVHRLPGSSPNEPDRWFDIDIYEQWSGLFSLTGNWYDFTFIGLSVEYSPYKGSCELEVSLLGVRVTITVIYDNTFTREMKRRVQELREKRK